MNVYNISDMVIAKTHCDYIAEQANMLKSLLKLSEDGEKGAISANRSRAFSAMSTMEDSIRELRFIFGELAEKDR